MTKVQSHVMLVLHNVRMEQLNMKRKKNTKCDKSTIKCNVRIAQYEDETIKYEKKNKGITKCDKKTVTCDVKTA